ncbi:hypothetical protein NBRC116493_22180 [Aurantivibrio infirmus]
MSRKSRYSNDWMKRHDDRKKSIELKFEKVKNFKKKKKATHQSDKSKKHISLGFGKYENKVNQDYRNRIQNTEYILFDSVNEEVKVEADNAYKDVASILLQAKEHKSLHVVLCWPAGIEWPLFSQTISNTSILNQSNFEDGIKVAIYPAAKGSISRGSQIRICRRKLIDEIKKDYLEKGEFTSRHNAYFALNDFDQDETNNIRQNPTLIDFTPVFEFSDQRKWSLVGGGFFKDVYTYMFNISGNTRRPAIDKISSVLNKPNKTPEGVFLLSSKVLPKNVVKASNDPINTDVLLVDGREEKFNSFGGSRDVIQKLIVEWANSDVKNSMVLLLDSPKIYQRTVYQGKETLKKSGLEKEVTNSFYKYSFLRLQTSLFDNYCADPLPSSRPLNELPLPPLLEIVGLRNYHQIAKLYKIANRVEPQDRNLCRSMYRAIGFIDRILSLPVSQSELLDWLRELTLNWSEADANRINKKYLWKSYRRDWFKNNDASTSVASIDEFLKTCDELEKSSDQTGEITELILNQLIEAQENQGSRSLILVKERRIAEFVKDLINDLEEDDDAFNVEVDVYSSSNKQGVYDRILILGLKHKDFKEVVFGMPKAVEFTKVYISPQIAFKIESEINIILELESFQDVHNRLRSIKDQIAPTLDSIRHLGIPREFSLPDGSGESYDYEYEHSSFANIYLSNTQVLDVGKETTIIRYSDGKYFATRVEEINEGDWIVPMDGFIEELEFRTNKDLSGYKNQDEALLKSYFKLAKRNIANNFDYKTRTERAKKILDEMSRIDPNVCAKLHKGMVNRWIKHIEDYEEDVETLLTRSAKNKESYVLFAKSLKIPTSLAEMFWENGIKANRVAHIQEGRGISAKIKHVLTGTMGGEQLNLNDEDIVKMLSLAKEKLCRVEMIALVEIDDRE